MFRIAVGQGCTVCGGEGHKRAEKLDFEPRGMGSHGGAWSELVMEITLWTSTGVITGGRGCDLGVRGLSQAWAVGPVGGMTSWDAVEGRNQELQTCAQASREFGTTVIIPIYQMRKWRVRWIEPRFEPKDVWAPEPKLRRPVVAGTAGIGVLSRT